MPNPYAEILLPKFHINAVNPILLHFIKHSGGKSGCFKEQNPELIQTNDELIECRLCTIKFVSKMHKS